MDFETVNYWQNPLFPTSVRGRVNIISSSGFSATTSEERFDNLLGILFDEEAAGYTTVNEWAQPTPFNARGGYYNQFWHFTDRYWNDFTENAVVFYMKDSTT